MPVATCQCARSSIVTYINICDIFRLKTEENLVKSVIYVIKSNLVRLRYEKTLITQYSSTFAGLANFLRIYFLSQQVFLYPTTNNIQASEQIPFLEFKSLFEFLNDFQDPQPLQKEIRLIVEGSALSVSEDVLRAVVLRILEEYKGNPRISDNITPVKGVLRLMQASRKIKVIIESDSNCKILLDNIKDSLN